MEAERDLECFKVPKEALLLGLMIVENGSPPDWTRRPIKQPLQALHPPDCRAEHLQPRAIVDVLAPPSDNAEVHVDIL